MKHESLDSRVLQEVQLCAFSRTHNPCPAMWDYMDMYIMDYLTNHSKWKDRSDYLELYYGLVNMYKSVHGGQL